MSGRFWIVIAALLGGLAVVAGAVGAHALPDTPALAVPVRIFNTGQLYHALHALALLSVGVVLLISEGHRTAWASRFLQLSAAAFALGIVCFSGGIYAQVATGFTSVAAVVPVGGSVLILGWILLAVGALALRLDRS